MGRLFYEPTFHTIDWIKRKIFNANERIKGKACKNEYHEKLHCVYWKQVASHITQIGQVSKNKNIPIIFLIHPVFEKDKTFLEYSLTSLHVKLGHLATDAGLIVVDGLAAYKTLSSDELGQGIKGKWYDPWHPNARGHRIISELLFKTIHEKAYIDKWLRENRELAMLDSMAYISLFTHSVPSSLK